MGRGIELELIDAIAMDMWGPAIQLTLAHGDDAPAKIVFDTCHIATHLHDAVDRVRKAEHRALKPAKDDRLTGTKVSRWLMRPQDLTDAQRATFRGLQRSDLKVARAWALKERVRQFWDSTYRGPRRGSSLAGSGAPPTAG